MAFNSVCVFTATLAMLCLASCISAHNITRLLSNYPEFSIFNSLLSQSKVADEINRRQTITVMAIDNSSAPAFSSLDTDTLKKALSIHVVLDYFDDAKLTKLAKNTTLLTTLFQSSGVANDRMGFLNYTKRYTDGRLLFGSAQPGAPLSSAFIKVVAVRPYNISVIQVSTAIIPPGLGGNPQEVRISPPAPPPAPAVSAPEVGPTPAEGPVAQSPDESADAPVLSPAADAPISDSPVDSPAKSPTRAESDDADVDNSSARKVVFGAASVFGALVLGAGALL
ncbi:Fasciclin-like arabinogalactan family protein [Rhynchospora pubera]|uniref:Fasciclin-like arabinogalactan family protein n=1 Tax=Rhynchospora pubera TaxID=906938 RepID=A0AAV8GFA8_9POAL|nr:Fasciclin-like arabinogalactan family protein [Rhynchospora pubera]